MCGSYRGVEVWSSQSKGVRVDAELRHSSTDLAIGTVTFSGSTLGLVGRGAPAPESSRNVTLSSPKNNLFFPQFAVWLAVCLRDQRPGILTQRLKGMRCLSVMQIQTKLRLGTYGWRRKSIGVPNQDETRTRRPRQNSVGLPRYVARNAWAQNR